MTLPVTVAECAEQVDIQHISLLNIQITTFLTFILLISRRHFYKQQSRNYFMQLLLLFCCRRQYTCNQKVSCPLEVPALPSPHYMLSGVL